MESPWLVGREEELERRVRRVKAGVEWRNRARERVEAMRRLRGVRRREREMQEELDRTREEVRVARKEVRRFVRGCEREWWEGKIRECGEACERGRVGEMYKCLRLIGKRGEKAGSGCLIMGPSLRSILRECRVRGSRRVWRC